MKIGTMVVSVTRTERLMYEDDPALVSGTNLTENVWLPDDVGIVLQTGPYHLKVASSGGFTGWVHASWVEKA